ncbi:MAG: hypothetical protein ACYSYL_21755 [Planctomycetota bacterium]|jgi:hypothetical protein
MNRKQEMILWIGLIVIQLMIVFPPVMLLEQAPEGVEEPPEISVVTNWVPGYGIIVRDYKHIRFGMHRRRCLHLAGKGTKRRWSLIESSRQAIKQSGTIIPSHQRQ